MSQTRHLKQLLISGLAAILALLLAACGAAPASTAAPTTVPGQAQLPLMNEAIDAVTQVAAAKGWSPLDSVPSPDGRVVYFTANGSAGPAVYKVASSGGEVTTLASGAPLAAPWGLSISTDGQTLYVADLGADTSTDGNVIFALPAGGGAPTRLERTAGSRPGVPEVVGENGTDMLYYSGFDPADQQPAIFKLNPAQSEAPTTIYKGAPLAWPSGVAVTKTGVVYVVDLAASGGGMGAVYRLQNGKAEKLADGLRTSGAIAGAALTLDESALLVSNLQAEQGTAQVLVVNLSSGALGLINKGLASNTGAGGVHRAHNVNQFSWADCTCPRPPRLPISTSASRSASSDGGGVYVLTTP